MLTFSRNLNFEQETDQNVQSLKKINPWNKYKLLQSQYDGLMDLEDKPRDAYFDPKYEYGLTLVDIDAEDYEMPREILNTVRITVLSYSQN